MENDTTVLGKKEMKMTRGRKKQIKTFWKGELQIVSKQSDIHPVSVELTSKFLPGSNQNLPDVFVMRHRMAFNKFMKRVLPGNMNRFPLRTTKSPDDGTFQPVLMPLEKDDPSTLMTIQALAHHLVRNGCEEVLALEECAGHLWWVAIATPVDVSLLDTPVFLFLIPRRYAKKVLDHIMPSKQPLCGIFYTGPPDHPAAQFPLEKKEKKIPSKTRKDAIERREHFGTCPVVERDNGTRIGDELQVLLGEGDESSKNAELIDPTTKENSINRLHGNRDLSKRSELLKEAVLSIDAPSFQTPVTSTNLLKETSVDEMKTEERPVLVEDSLSIEMSLKGELPEKITSLSLPEECGLQEAITSQYCEIKSTLASKDSHSDSVDVNKIMDRLETVECKSNSDLAMDAHQKEAPKYESVGSSSKAGEFVPPKKEITWNNQNSKLLVSEDAHPVSPLTVGLSSKIGALHTENEYDKGLQAILYKDICGKEHNYSQVHLKKRIRYAKETGSDPIDSLNTGDSPHDSNANENIKETHSKQIGNRCGQLGTEEKVRYGLDNVKIVTTKATHTKNLYSLDHSYSSLAESCVSFIDTQEPKSEHDYCCKSDNSSDNLHTSESTNDTHPKQREQFSKYRDKINQSPGIQKLLIIKKPVPEEELFTPFIQTTSLAPSLGCYMPSEVPHPQTPVAEVEICTKHPFAINKDSPEITEVNFQKVGGPSDCRVNVINETLTDARREKNVFETLNDTMKIIIPMANNLPTQNECSVASSDDHSLQEPPRKRAKIIEQKMSKETSDPSLFAQVTGGSLKTDLSSSIKVEKQTRLTGREDEVKQTYHQVKWPQISPSDSKVIFIEESPEKLSPGHNPGYDKEIQTTKKVSQHGQRKMSPTIPLVEKGEPGTSQSLVLAKNARKNEDPPVVYSRDMCTAGGVPPINPFVHPWMMQGRHGQQYMWYPYPYAMNLPLFWPPNPNNMQPFMPDTVNFPFMFPPELPYCNNNKNDK